MKKFSFFLCLLYIFLGVCGSIYGLEEKTLVLGGKSTWTDVESLDGVTEVTSVRPYPVLALSSAAGAPLTNTAAGGYSAATGVMGNLDVLTEPALDMSLSFLTTPEWSGKDKTGNYTVTVLPEAGVTDRFLGRTETGTLLFGGQSVYLSAKSEVQGNAGASSAVSGGNALIVEPHSSRALFAPNNRIRDFTIEFWIQGFTLENGEQIFSWTASLPLGDDFISQQIHCVANRNRLQWTFLNFFTSADGTSHNNLSFTGMAAIVPKSWSHHLVRFDASTGMVEYLVNGVSEAIVYATPTGRESANVFTPLAGKDGQFTFGESFTGIMDEIKIHSAFINRSLLQRYSPSGGRMETRPLDLGKNSSVIKIDVTGGRFNISRNQIIGEFRKNGRYNERTFRFDDDSEMQFFIRSSDNPWLLNKKNEEDQPVIPWVSFIPGMELPNKTLGRYVQIAVDFYPSADGENTPYLEELRIIYNPGEPPMPPVNVTAVAMDGSVMLRWKNSPHAFTKGYLVYYGTVRGEYFGIDAAWGPSPIDAGNVNSIQIDGLKNGTLYYFAVAAYDFTTDGAYNIGEFSGEVTARPLTMSSEQ